MPEAAFFQTLVENARDVSAVTDRGGRFIYLSPAGTEYLGLSVNTASGTLLFDRVHPDDLSLLKSHFLSVTAGTTATAHTVVRFRNWEDSWLHLDTLIQLLTGVDGEENVLVTLRDVSRRIEAEKLLKEYNEKLKDEVANRVAALKEKNDELEHLLADLKNAQAQLVQQEKMASLGQVTAGIAHEINNPINFVSANIAPLKADFADLKTLLDAYAELHQSPDPAAELARLAALRQEMNVEMLIEEITALLGGIEEGASRTKEIVVGLRTFSRLDEAGVKLTDLHEGLNSTLMILRNKIKGRIQVVKEYGDLPLVECYPGKLNQVFMNLLNNAADAIPEKGTIFIRTWAEEEQVHLTFRDTGSGIPPEVQERIFEPFFTTKDVGEGTGLGLSISCGIIQRHRGTITVSSQPGEGTEFHITLPVTQNASLPE